MNKSLLLHFILFFLIFFIFSGCAPQYEKKSYGDAWTNGEIIYNFNAHVSQGDRDLIEACFDEIEINTKCIYFIKKNSKKSIEIQYSNNGLNLATIGMNNKNRILLTQPLSKRAIYHETLHAIGLEHEHQRPDRLNYIEIIYDNILYNYKEYFEIVDHLYNTDEFKYDCKSIMHYPPHAFSNAKSIVFLNSEDYYYSKKPTQLDYQKIKAIYK